MKTHIHTLGALTFVIRHSTFVIGLLLLLPAWTVAQTITSAVPGTISYQGRVLNSSGGLVGGTGTPVNRTVIFRIWDHPSNTLPGNLLYSEQQTVTIAEGEFSVLVGQGTGTSIQTFGYSETAKGPPTVSLPNVFNGATRYLGVTVAAGASIQLTDNEITPRQQIVGSAFAFRAKFAETLGTSVPGANPPLTVVDGGNIGVGTSAPPALFTISGSNNSSTTNTPQLVITDPADLNERLLIGMNNTGNGSGVIQATKVGTGAQNLLLNPSGGNVGIGMTTAPTSRLDVAGGIKASGAGGFTFNSGDADGGLFSPADGVLTLFTNNSERLRVDGSGNVGIGTAPGHRLHVVGGNTVVQGSGAGDSIGYAILNSAGVERAAFGMVGGTGQYSSDAVLGDAVLRSPGKLLLQSGNGASAICINTSNNVGIGTATPGERLTIVGSGSTSASTALSVFNSSLGNLFSVRNDGKVGIGTAPDATLHVVSQGTGSGNNTAAFSAPNIGVHQSHIHYGTTGNWLIRSASATGTVIIQDSGGNVGIGTGSPTQAKLVVSGFINATGPGSGNYSWITSSSTNYNQASTSIGTSIYASHAIWSGTYLQSSSDQRIKIIDRLSDGVADLETLLSLEVTDYHYKDKISKGSAPHKKLIAQQIEKTFPQAVSKQTEVVPDIYQISDFKDGWVEMKTDLKKGERIQLADDKTMKIVEVLEVKKDKFRTAFIPDGNKIFVYGREVKDFRTVDYDAISMLNVSATQQIKKEKDAEVKLLKEENADLKARVIALEAQTQRLADLEAKDKAREAKLAAIEKLLMAADKAAVKPVSLKKSAGGAE